MRPIVSKVCCAALAWSGVSLAAQSAHAATLCVAAADPSCFAAIQPAFDAAHDGDTIKIGPGTFAGGVSIDASVRIVGAGSRATVIHGGGPVLTVGVEFADTEPTVLIQGVTITGGSNTSVPDHSVTFGGGVRIPQAGSFPFRTGATVTIRDSVIPGNSVASLQLLPAGFCGPSDCSFANGGGISNDGTLTLINTWVTDNQAGAPGVATTNAGAGGVASSQRGTLVLRHSFVTGNRVVVTPPFGSEGHGGGITSNGPLVVEDSVVRGNTVDVSASAPHSENGEAAALAGGIHVGDCCGQAGVATITRTIVSGNRVLARNTPGDTFAFAGGVLDEATLVLSDSVVDHNDVRIENPPTTTGLSYADGGGLEVDGTAPVRNTLISSNTVSSAAANGTVISQGGGVANAGRLRLERSLVLGNRASATGTGVAQGGGVWNGTFGGPPPTLELVDTLVAGNKLVAGSGVTAEGGGLFTTFPVSLTRTVVAGNAPDQCVGC